LLIALAEQIEALAVFMLRMTDEFKDAGKSEMSARHLY
jgi:hypothetical protein